MEYRGPYRLPAHRAHADACRNLPAPKLARAPDHAADSLEADQRHPEGRALHASLCAGCHTWAGANEYVPRALLTGTRSVNDPAAVNVALALLHGAAPSSISPEEARRLRAAN